MTNFTKTLVHYVDVYTRTDTNVGGRITQTWTNKGNIPCRFSSPVSTRASPVEGASIEKIDATIYTGPELLTVISPVKPPMRFVCVDPGWYGTFEMRSRPRVFNAGKDSVHHCECDVVEVNE